MQMLDLLVALMSSLPLALMLTCIVPCLLLVIEGSLQLIDRVLLYALLVKHFSLLSVLLQQTRAHFL